jgi:acyl dehydratase
MESEPSNLLPSGFRYELHKTVTATDIHLWAGLTGKRSSAQRASAFAQRQAAAHQFAPDAYLTGLVVDTAACLAACFPSPGASLTGLAIQFTASVHVGTTLSVTITVMEWDAAAGLYWLDVCATRADGTQVVTGKAGLRPHRTLLAAA